MSPKLTCMTSASAAIDDVLTTSQVARLCGVSQRTVIRWVERDELHAYKLPGRGDHRVTAVELRRFMRKHGMPEPDGQAGGPLRVLIVEDDVAMARAINRVLKRAGFETAFAGNGFLAGSLLHSFRPALMTLDIRMPWMDGLQVLRLLRKTPPPAPLKVLVLSGDDRARLDEALRAGADAALAKPFTNDELLDAVYGLIGRPHQTAASQGAS
jgi:excisionase family DNA binding protein